MWLCRPLVCQAKTHELSVSNQEFLIPFLFSFSFPRAMSYIRYFHLLIKFVNHQSDNASKYNTNQIDTAGSNTYSKALERNNYNSRGDNNTYNSVKYNTVMSFHQSIYSLCQQNDSHQGTCADWDHNIEIEVSDFRYQRCVEPYRHQQCRKAQSRRNNTQSNTKTAEQIPSKIRRNFRPYKI